MDITGIYALFWPISNMVYVGQSQKINIRFRDHLSSLKRKDHANPKVQYQYSKYGTPELVILEECSITNLYDREVFWTNEFDALNFGLNIVEPGPAGWGVNSSQSKYNKAQVLKVFSLLTTTNLANIDIANKIKVSLRLVECIRGGYSHTWLKDKYPDRYTILYTKPKVKNTAARKKGSSIRLINIETGQIHEVESVVDFTKSICKVENSAFASGIRRLIRKEQHSYKDWALECNKDLFIKEIYT